MFTTSGYVLFVITNCSEGGTHESSIIQLRSFIDSFQNVGRVPPYLEKIKQKLKEEGNSSAKSLSSRQSPTQRENEPPPRASVDRRVRVLSEKERQELLKVSTSFYNFLPSFKNLFPGSFVVTESNFEEKSENPTVSR